MLEGMQQRHVRVLVVWEPILATDWARPGASILARVHDTRARQFWDKENLFPRKLGERIHGDQNHPKPDCCWQDGIPWDMVALYPAGARWDEELPAAAFVEGPVWRVTEALAEAVHKQTEKEVPVQGRNNGLQGP